MNVLSLFDGISIGRLALDKRGIDCSYYSSEVDKYAIEISNNNYPDIIRLGDVTEIDENKLKELPKIDLLIGGSPCQGFSRQGKCLNFEDARSKLFFEYIRILKWLRNNNNPNIKFMLENVHMKKEWENTITEYIGVESKDINSKLVSAQNRPRLYWTNICIDDITDKNIKLLDILEYVDTSEYINHQGLKIDPSINKKALNIINVVDGEVRISQATKKGYIIAENGDGVNLGFPNSKSRRGRVVKQKSPTLDCGCDVCVYYDGIIRKLTISELEKLQTLPVGYTEGVSEARRKHAIGNGWTTDVIVHILKDLK